jgi:hypothetical protein
MGARTLVTRARIRRDTRLGGPDMLAYVPMLDPTEDPELKAAA